MKSKIWLFMLVLLFACGFVHAEEDGMISTSISKILNSTEPLPWAVVTGFESKHVGGHPELNGHNRGIGVRAEGWLGCWRVLQTATGAIPYMPGVSSSGACWVRVTMA